MDHNYLKFVHDPQIEVILCPKQSLITSSLKLARYTLICGTILWILFPVCIIQTLYVPPVLYWLLWGMLHHRYCCKLARKGLSITTGGAPLRLQASGMYTNTHLLFLPYGSAKHSFGLCTPPTAADPNPHTGQVSPSQAENLP